MLYLMAFDAASLLIILFQSAHGIQLFDTRSLVFNILIDFIGKLPCSRLLYLAVFSGCICIASEKISERNVPMKLFRILRTHVQVVHH